MTPSVEEFPALVLGWFDRYGRHDLPWQRDPTPYRVWVSEIMLQQTQVGVVLPYFERFMAFFPTLSDLAGAELDAVLAQWSGLGYYARARHLHRAAVLIRDRYGAVFPEDFETVRRLPGIGRSTAGAILSLACGQRHPILDGNVKRVLARVFGIDGWPGQGQVLARLWQLAEQCTPQARAGDYNQGMMDLGATLCTRARPDCARCPLAERCVARLQGRQHALPAPRPRRDLPTRTTTLLAILNPSHEILLERRPQIGLWGGLWSLPETDLSASAVAALADWCQDRLGLRPERVERLPARRHSFSHYHLRIELVRIELGAYPSRVQDSVDWCWNPLGRVSELGLSAPIARILDDLDRLIRTA
ncbi:MAG: A/G-specific adenine glycosylase [Thermochromatium sp.]